MISNYQLFKLFFVESAKVAKSVATKMQGVVTDTCWGSHIFFRSILKMEKWRITRSLLFQ